MWLGSFYERAKTVTQMSHLAFGRSVGPTMDYLLTVWHWEDRVKDNNGGDKEGNLQETNNFIVMLCGVMKAWMSGGAVVVVRGVTRLWRL